ncbi:MAG: hypothetical protein KDD35_08095, partial [Bdellovibrionales bacterium]|nr:hypothetical protein [Bdellovibrionales bacterium]
HSKTSPETLQLLEQQEKRIMSEMHLAIKEHEKVEMQSYEEIKKMFLDHIEETKSLNEAFRSIIDGGKVISFTFNKLVRIVAGLGILVGAFIAFREWFLRGR